jgi:hypothetical protein
MAKIDAANAKQPFGMTAGANVQFGTPSLSVSQTQFSWISQTGVDVDIFGQNLTYSGDGLAQQLAGGTVSTVVLDVNNDAGGLGDLLITGIQGADAANINKNNPESFWNEILKGDDEFDLTGMSVANVGSNGGGSYFGDDLKSRMGFLPQGPTDSGGDDTINGGDNSFVLIGDVTEVRGELVGGFLLSAVYDAGNDTITSAATAHTVVMYGDTFTLGSAATLNAGNDILDNRGSTGAASMVVGDGDGMFGGVLNGGNDIINTDSSVSPSHREM